MKIYSNKRKNTICQNTKIAKSFSSRLKGLLGLNSFTNFDGLLLINCRQIHSIGMKFIFDAIYLDKNYKILSKYSNIAKNKILPYNINAKYVLELPSGTIEKYALQIDEYLEFEE